MRWLILHANGTKQQMSLDKRQLIQVSPLVQILGCSCQASSSAVAHVARVQWSAAADRLIRN